MAGIYVHIPFCKQACHYCNFHFSTNQTALPAMIEAIMLETTLNQHYLQEKVQTIYFGGGTPSLCSIEQITQMLAHFKQLFLVDEDAEITLETNPDDITEDKLIAWKAIGINRLSIGVQSFVEEDLQWMNRAHNSKQSLQSLQLIQQYFSNITIDLIYGTPTLTNEQWIKNIDITLALNIPHISCYALTVEPKTALEKFIEKKQLQNIDAEKQAQHFEILVNKLSLAGFEHYEISNFAKPGFRSKHNSSYWQGKHYLGLGPSAHSFNGISRQWNIANNALYLKSIEQNTIPFEIEMLTKVQQLNEYIMTTLRTIEGISLQYIQANFGEVEMTNLLNRASIHINNQSIQLNNDCLQLTNAAKFLADGIAADLFV
jgi:oxygen-independent coproporphyrinogen-3 oxidase